MKNKARGKAKVKRAFGILAQYNQKLYKQPRPLFSLQNTACFAFGGKQPIDE